MFAVSTFFLLTIVLTSQGSEVINPNGNPDQPVIPYDLEDEVRQQLDDLKFAVRGVIFAAFTSIDNAVRDVAHYRNDLLDQAKITIQQAYQTHKEQITTMKDLAAANNQNIDACLVDNEPLLDQLPQQKIDSLLECLVFANVEMTVINNDARYYIDILMNEANIFEYQIDMCGGEFLCLSPVVTLIELALEEIPQKIAEEVQKGTQLCAELKVQVKDCSDNKIGEYEDEGGIIIEKVTTCVN